MSTGIRSDSSGGISYIQVDGADVIEIGTNYTEFSGIINSKNYHYIVSSLNSDSIVVSSDSNGLLTRAATGNIVFSSPVSYISGSVYKYRILSGASSRTLTFPSGWVFLGTKPSSISASKTGVLTITCYGTTESDVVAEWYVQS